jgi:hypothetical protein
VVPGSKEHIPNSAENYAPWLCHDIVPSSAVDLIPSSVVDKDPWLCHVATPSSAARHPPAQLWALKQKQPMALPQGSPQLRCEATPNSVAGPLCNSATDSVPSSTMDNESINPMHIERSAMKQTLALLWGHKMHWHARIRPYVAKQAHSGVLTTAKARIKARLEIMIEGAEAAHQAWLPKNPRSQRVIPLL